MPLAIPKAGGMEVSTYFMDWAEGRQSGQRGGQVLVRGQGAIHASHEN